MKVNKICKYCNTKFETTEVRVKDGRGKFCSKKCFDDFRRGKANPALRNRILRKCSVCGKAFHTIPSRIQEGRGVYCSKECYYNSKKGKRSRNWDKVRIICLVCGKYFFVNRARAKHGSAKFCSKECYRLSLIGKAPKSAVRIGPWKQRITCSCQMCGKTYLILPSHIKLGSRSGKFCSSNCYWKSLKCKSSWNKGKQMSEETKEKLRKARLKQIIPLKDTKPERLVQNELSNRNIPFKTHIPVLGQPDIFIEPNICVFCDGDYFHANPSMYNADKIILKGKTASYMWERDKWVKKELEKQGFKVFRFWESNIKKDVKSCVDNIEKALR